jgi:voltage-gated potassium channel Kch
MTKTLRDFVSQYVVGQFRRAAIVTHYGDEDEDPAMQLAGIRSAKRAVKVFDSFGADGRLALVPLLSDPDQGVRAFAAGYLVKVMPERALAVLKDVQEHGPMRASMTALHLLGRYERGELNM